MATVAVANGRDEITVAVDLLGTMNDPSNSFVEDYNGDGVNYLDSQLHNDCLKGDDKVVDEFLSSRSDKEKKKLLNAINCNGYTPLHIACEQEHAEVVKILMKHGASPIICSQSDPLYQRLTNQNGDIKLKRDDNSENRHQNMQEILNSLQADEVYVHYFMKCVDRSNGRNICYRINSKFFVGSTPLHVAAKNGSLKILKILLHFLNEGDINRIDNYKRTALYVACKEGHAPATRQLLEHGANTDISEGTFERTPLHFACELGHVQLVELLLRHGADINKLTCLDYTALHTASENGYAQIIELLLDHGADIKLTDTLGRPALQLACEKGHAQVVELLLKHGAYIELTHDSYNKEVMYTTLLVTACKSGHAKVVELLLEYDADITKCDENGLNPLDIAVEKGQTDAAMAIVNSIKWKDALCNTVTNRRDERLRSRLARRLRYNKTEPEFTTPMRRIINKMPDVAKVVFDRCYKTEASPDHPDYKTTFNFELLEDFVLDENDENTKWPPKFKYSSQNHCLNILANSHCPDLLKHPLAKKLLNLKWNKYGLIFYSTNLIIYLIFVILLTSFALVLKSPNSSICMEAFGNDTNCSEEVSVRQRFLSVARVLLIIISVLMIIRELVQVALFRLQYLTSFVNFIEVPLFILTIMFAPVRGNHCYCTRSWQWQIGVIAVFLGWIALIFSIRKLPIVGIYVVMFIEIFKNFMKVVILALLLIFAFAFPLYMIFYDPQLRSEGIRTPFSTIWRTIVKTIIMTMGEYGMDSLLQQNNQQDSSDIQYPVVAFSLLIVFVVLMPILFLNLLTSLAVGDTQKIRKSADTYRLILKVEFILPIEEFFRNIVTISRNDLHVDDPSIHPRFISFKLKDIVCSWLLFGIDVFSLKNRLLHYIVIEREQTIYPNKSNVLKQLINSIFESKNEEFEPPPATIADVKNQIKPLSEEIKDLRTSVSQEVKELRSSVDHLLAIVKHMRKERVREVKRKGPGAQERTRIQEEEEHELEDI